MVNRNKQFRCQKRGNLIFSSVDSYERISENKTSVWTSLSRDIVT